MAEEDRVVGEEPGETHPQEGRQKGPGRRIAQTDLGVGNEVVEQGQGDKQHRQGHGPAQRIKE